MGGAHQALVPIADGFEQQLLAAGVEFSEHVVEQKQRWFTHHLVHQFQFGQLEGQYQGALLARRAVAARRIALELQGDFIAVGADCALAQPQLVGPLGAQLVGQGLAPGGFAVVATCHGGDAAAAVLEFQPFTSAAEAFVPVAGQGSQTLQRSLAASVQSGPHQGHLNVKGIQECAAAGRVVRRLPQQLAALAQQASVAAQQLAVEGFKLQHHPVEPVAPQGRFTADQLQIQSTEPHAAQVALQVLLALQHLAVAQGLAATAAAQLQHQVVAAGGGAAEPGRVLLVLDELAVVTGAVGSQAAEQLHRLEQVRFALAVAAQHQQAGRFDRQIQLADVAKAQQLQALQPNRPDAVSG